MASWKIKDESELKSPQLLDSKSKIEHFFNFEAEVACPKLQIYSYHLATCAEGLSTL